MPAVKGFFGRIPILGPLIVGIVSLMSGEPPGQALFKAIGAALGGALGTFIPIPILGTLLGETIGVFVGDLMYHLVIRRDPQAAFKMLKDTIMGIFGFLTKIPILGDIIRLWQQGGNILLNFGKWVFMDAIPWAAAKIGSIGQIISEWMTSGVQRFMDTFPSFEIPNWGIQDLVSDILSMKWPRWITDINIMGWRPFGGYEDQPVFPWFQGEFPEWFENLPRMPRVLGWLWQNVPLLNNLVDSNGEVHKIPKLWLLANPIFMHGHLKSSFFPGMGAGSADSGGSVSGGSNGSSEDAAAVSESASYEEGGEGEAMIIPVPIVTPANTTVTSGGGGGGGTSSRERADDPMLVLYSG